MSFRLGSIPIRVHYAFFLMALFLGANDRDPRLIAIWMAVVFVSVLVHELGHALMGKAFGLSPRIDLHGMGGTTSWTAGPSPLHHGKRIAISLAGPFAGFVLGALVIFFARRGLPETPLVKSTVASLIWVNIGWGIFNLLPLLPLDGGNVMRSVIDALTKGRGEKPSRIVSIAMCAGLLALAAYWRSWWIGALAIMFGISNFRALRGADRQRADAALAQAIETAQAAVERQEGATAITLLGPALALDVSPEMRAAGVPLYGYALLLEGKWNELVPFLEKERELVHPEDLARFAHTARELGHAAEADRIDALVRAPAPLGEFRA